MIMKRQKGEAGLELLGIAAGITAIALVVFTLMWGWTHFRLWKAEYIGRAFEIEKEYRGKGILAEAEYAKKARIEQASAELAAAKDTAAAIEIVGRAAKQYPEYRQQEFMLSFGEALREGVIDQVIYVPTEGNVPVMEAGKR